MTFDVLHDEIRRAIRHLTRVQHPDDARMIYSRERFNFLSKLSLDPSIIISFQHLLKKDFDDDRLTHQLLVVRQVNNADSATPQLPLNQITTVERSPFITSAAASVYLIRII